MGTTVFFTTTIPNFIQCAGGLLDGASRCAFLLPQCKCSMEGKRGHSRREFSNGRAPFASWTSAMLSMRTNGCLWTPLSRQVKTWLPSLSLCLCLGERFQKFAAVLACCAPAGLLPPRTLGGPSAETRLGLGLGLGLSTPGPGQARGYGI